MDYNSNRKHLLLPEYGRNVQKMVDHALTIEDREERNAAAKSIISLMGSMYPHLRDVSDFRHKLWDHLAIMSDFKLDIDSPFESPTKEKLAEKPDLLPYNSHKIKYKHYGKTVEYLIEEAIKLEGEKQDALVLLIANHMKKSYLNWNKDSVLDIKIFDDIEKMSDGKIIVSEGIKLRDSREQFNKNRKRKMGGSNYSSNSRMDKRPRRK
ncbi:MAG: DUF4290 domain-containing protein [Marinifilaceae bacterium]|jgi:hypothetical protein|nr:DUF4290 domain-containing protein [Marinifilaceae bacterium]